MTKNVLMELEEKVLKELEFKMHYAGPIPFLERFMKFFGLDENRELSPGKQIDIAARQFLKTL